MGICLNRAFKEDRHQPAHPGADGTAQTLGILPAAVKLNAPEVGKLASGNDQEPTSSLRQLANLNHSA